MKSLHPINRLSTLTSLTVLLVTIERFSFTTKVLLQPYDFLRLHEVFQMVVLITLTVIVPFLLLRIVTNTFEGFKTNKGMFLGVLFIVGVYFYATGNGVHELASFIFNTYCDPKNITGALCGGQFINDYYFGNGLYFIGAMVMNLVLVLFEGDYPNQTFKKSDRLVLIINSLVYALAIFAYAAFDRVLVGFVYSASMMLIINMFVYYRRTNVWKFPVTVSLAIAYTIGTLASLFVRV